MSEIFDMIIIGAGPAGLGSAVYAARAGLNVLLIEKTMAAGGQIINTAEVDNYLGLPGIGGFEMGQTFKAHAEKMGTKFAQDEVVSIDVSGDYKSVSCKKETYKAKTIIIATGAVHSKLNVPGENEYIGSGVSYCATCDGAFFRGLTTVVVGGGDVAVGDAIYLAGLCSKVYLIHRRDTLRANASLQNALKKLDNVEIIWNSKLIQVNGKDLVESVVIDNKEKGEMEIPAEGVFIAVGMEPETSFLKNVVELDERGYVCAGEDCKTSVEGIYAAGDIRTKNVRQVITAVADGACAVASAEQYLQLCKVENNYGKCEKVDNIYLI